MIEPQCLNVQCPQCNVAWMLPLNGATYICPACQYVAYAKDLKEKQSAIYRKFEETSSEKQSDDVHEGSR